MFGRLLLKQRPRKIQFHTELKTNVLTQEILKYLNVMNGKIRTWQSFEKLKLFHRLNNSP